MKDINCFEDYEKKNSSIFLGFSAVLNGTLIIKLFSSECKDLSFLNRSIPIDCHSYKLRKTHAVMSVFMYTHDPQIGLNFLFKVEND